MLLSLGLVCIGMALARCILTVTDPATYNTSSLWAQREAIVAIVVVNAPVLVSLFHRTTWSSPKRPVIARFTDTWTVGQGTPPRKDNKQMHIYKTDGFEVSSRNGSAYELMHTQQEPEVGATGFETSVRTTVHGG